MEPYFERPGYIEFRLGDYQQGLGGLDHKYNFQGCKVKMVGPGRGLLACR